ncbi:hypothetical protein JKP88DRAFT_272334 [Tribonema minus]|uniref:Uncharacterized protein n=1 Tax=Tribonema minus TaxID=303371 RepID=A0A835ZJ30_9STRA|nr:hypothetical protein JKP88DRAFT_272334 [Tribonema minus]
MEQGIQAALIVVAVILFLVICSLYTLFRPRRPRMFTPLELDEIRLRKEEEREAALDEKIQAMQQRKKMHSTNRMMLTARTKTARVVDEEGGADWDEKGRAVYGSAWDEPNDGNLPLRELFNLPDEEIRAAKAQAAQLVEMQTYRQLTVRHTAQPPPTTAAPSPRPHYTSPRPTPPLPVTSSAQQQHPAAEPLMTARANRAAQSRPAYEAPYDDPRFVVPRGSASESLLLGENASGRIMARGALGGALPPTVRDPRFFDVPLEATPMPPPPAARSFVAPPPPQRQQQQVYGAAHVPPNVPRLALGRGGAG